MKYQFLPENEHYETSYPEHARTSCSDDNPSNADPDGSGCPRCNAIYFDKLDWCIAELAAAKCDNEELRAICRSVCRCAARCASECSCDDVDWTPKEVVELRAALEAAEQKVKELESQVEAFFTNTDHGITMQDRNFRVDGDDTIYDENFDHDAAIKIHGDFAEGDKLKYTQMICGVLNQHMKLTAKLESSEPVAEIVLEDMGKPFRASIVRCFFIKKVPTVGTKLYTSPPNVKAAVSAVLRKAAEVCYQERDGYDEPQTGWDMKNPLHAEYSGYQRACNEISNKILAIPADDSALRSLLSDAVTAAFEWAGIKYIESDVEAIVDEVLGK